VGSDYQTLTNRDAFAFTTPLATLGAAYDSAGFYGQGQHVFLTMKLEREALEEDPHDVYLLTRTSHDGSKSIQALVTPVRRRCKNQDALITRTAESRWTVRHNSTMEARLAEAQESLKKTFKYVDSFEETARRLLAIDLETEQLQKMLEQSLPQTKRQGKLVDAIVSVRENSPLLDDIRPTAWGALQSFTEWTDHHRPFRRPETRMKAVIDGWAAQVRNDLARRMLTRA
jgi:phage/plasmid-like protein (TIGR03299 family)